MKILAIHADYLNFEAKKEAIQNPEPVDNPKESMKECLVVFMSVESGDEKDPENVKEQLIDHVKDIAEKVNTKDVVLYPYAHLSSDLGSPKLAQQLLQDSHKALEKVGFNVKHAPFGWYKSFEISCKGHPLSELSREITVTDKKKFVAQDQPFEFSEKELSKDEQTQIQILEQSIMNSWQGIFPLSEKNKKPNNLSNKEFLKNLDL